MQENKRKKIIIVGAGPGGLTAGMILGHRGFQVEIFEKQAYIGGRTSPQKIDGYTFELGPTFVMLPQIFEEIFELSGKKLAEYVVFKELPVMYRLRFADGKSFRVYYDKEKLKEEIEANFPGEAANYQRWFDAQKIKFDKMYPCLKIPYAKPWSYLNPKLLKAFPYMDIFSSLYNVLAKYFQSEKLRIAMTFQAKYLGMSPWECPGPFSILSYIEHAFGIYHPMGGVHKITEAMAKVASENGVKINLSSEVKRILFEHDKASGIELSDGRTINADAIIMNADFARGMSGLVPESRRPSWNDKKLEQSGYSCSTFMLYLGLKKKYDFEHHNIVFAADYKKNIEEIFKSKILPQDPSFYIQNASVTDKSLAPEGHSTIYILVPVPNNVSGIDWPREKGRYRDLVMRKIKENTEMTDIEDQIEVEKIITPDEWQSQKDIFNGAVFNLAHTLGQMLYLRPHNKFEDTENLYLAGGGTHPGSGLPTIVESGRIVADIITKKYE